MSADRALNVNTRSQLPAPATHADPDTVIGVDLGVRNSVVAAPEHCDPYAAQALTVPGGVARDLLSEFVERTPSRDASADAELANRYAAVLSNHVERVVDRLLDYLREFEGELLVAVERVSFGEPATVVEFRDDDRAEANKWLLPMMRDRIVERCYQEGIRTILVDGVLSSKICGWCGDRGHRTGSGRFVCEGDCPISILDGDRNAAVTLANRARSRGDDR
ncbi:hypothetical protein JCM17823_14630 [Halorubrum gandharaense]